MAIRTVFVALLEGVDYVKEYDVNLKWHGGFAIGQSQKNISELHAGAKELGFDHVLEISSKSEKQLGRALSAFNLKLSVGKELCSSVESIFQGSKVFEDGGPFTDLYEKSSREAKTDQRLKESGALIKFDLLGEIWELNPTTAFYDWLYMMALKQNSELALQMIEYTAFTDIAFNPEKSLNCQARSAALFTSLVRRGVAKDALSSKNIFLDYLRRASVYSLQQSYPVMVREPQKQTRKKRATPKGSSTKKSDPDQQSIF